MSITGVTPYLAVHDARAAIAWYGTVFGATIVEDEFYEDGDRIGHASLRIGDVGLYVSDEYPEMGAESPQTLGGTSVAVVLHVDGVEQVDERWRTATEAGASADRPPADQMDFRACWFRDPWGHRWSVMAQLSG